MSDERDAELKHAEDKFTGDLDDLNFGARPLPEIPADADEFTRKLLERERYMKSRDAAPPAKDEPAED